jgi:phosphinothricin acetyltransferase
MKQGSVVIRKVRPDDAAQICGIYNYYIANTTTSFEEAPVTTAEMAARIEAVTRDFPWYVYEENGEITAYAYLHYYHTRRAYRFTAEDSIYVKNGCQHKGIGKKLLALLIADAERLGLHTIMARLGLPTAARERLHRAVGF